MISDTLENKLTQAFSPQRLEVINESHLHAGHAGDNGTGESHFRVRIVAETFAGMSRINRHRAINDLVSPLLEKGLHAIAIEAKAPGE